MSDETKEDRMAVLACPKKNAYVISKACADKMSKPTAQVSMKALISDVKLFEKNNLRGVSKKETAQ